eukprot:4637100-Karenia_brevis.AAC.1
MCDKSHDHKPWGLMGSSVGFATAEERQYPDLFCARMASLVKSQFAPSAPVGNLSALRQPRRNHQCLIPCWKSQHVYQFDGDQEELQQRITNAVTEFPKDAKVIAITSGGLSGQSSFAVGIPWTKAEFVDQAKKLEHPFDRQLVVQIPDAINWKSMAEIGPWAVVEQRQKCLQSYAKVQASLRQEEAKLKAAMDPRVRHVVARKNILLFKR